MNKKIGFIGAGNVTKTLILGLVEHFEGINQQIYITNRSRIKGEELRDLCQVHLLDSNEELAQICDIIFLSVKPDIYPKVLSAIQPYINDEKLLISVAAGTQIEDVQQYFNEPKKIIRIMPNIAVTVSAGMIAMCCSPQITRKELDLTMELLKSVGRVDLVDEYMLDAVTCVSGCSPAFIALFIEAMADASVLQGMPREKAYQYAAQTLIGTGKLILEKNIHPGPLKDLVTSPGGATIEGIYVLERKGFRSIVMEAMEACDKKLKAMAKK